MDITSPQRWWRLRRVLIILILAVLTACAALTQEQPAEPTLQFIEFYSPL